MATQDLQRNRSSVSSQRMTEIEPLDIARCWHAGQAGCGALLMGLKRQIESIAPGERLQVMALDAAASIDIAAWCEMTGHTLCAYRHPTYVVQRRAARPGSTDSGRPTGADRPGTTDRGRSIRAATANRQGEDNG